MRIERLHLGIIQGNVLQGALLMAGIALLWLCTKFVAPAAQVAAMLAGYLGIYFSVHAPAHWLMGRLGGIRFTHYSVGGSTHASAYPPGMRQVFQRLPFFAVHASKPSLKAASPVAKALMFGAGMTSSVVCCTLAALWLAWSGAPGGMLLLIVNCIWFAGALIGEARTRGDYAKAAEALRPLTLTSPPKGEG